MACSCCSFLLTERSRRALAWLLVLLNLLQALAGLAAVGFSAYLYLHLAQFSEILEGRHGNDLEFTLVGTGCSMVILHGLTALVCSRMSNPRTRNKSQAPWLYVLMYALLVPLAVLVGAVGIVTVTHKGRLQASFRDGLGEALDHYREFDSSAWKALVDRLQMSFACCGVDGFHDWLSIPWSRSEGARVPFSCCDPATPTPCSHDALKAGSIGDSLYSVGCTKAIGDSLLRRFLQPGAQAASGIFLCELVLLVLFRFLQTSCDIASSWGDPLQAAPGYLCGDPPLPPAPPVNEADVESSGDSEAAVDGYRNVSETVFRDKHVRRPSSKSLARTSLASVVHPARHKTKHQGSRRHDRPRPDNPAYNVSSKSDTTRHGRSRKAGDHGRRSRERGRDGFSGALDQLGPSVRPKVPATAYDRDGRSRDAIHGREHARQPHRSSARRAMYEERGRYPGGAGGVAEDRRLRREASAPLGASRDRRGLAPPPTSPWDQRRRESDDDVGEEEPDLWSRFDAEGLREVMERREEDYGRQRESDSSSDEDERGAGGRGEMGGEIREKSKKEKKDKNDKKKKDKDRKDESKDKEKKRKEKNDKAKKKENDTKKNKTKKGKSKSKVKKPKATVKKAKRRK